MKIAVQLNGEPRQVNHGLTVGALIDELSLPKQRVAVELNRAVVRRKDWRNTELSDGDTLEIIHFVGGG